MEGERAGGRDKEEGWMGGGGNRALGAVPEVATRWQKAYRLTIQGHVHPMTTHPLCISCRIPQSLAYS